MLEGIIIVVFTAANLAYSWTWLTSPRVHGFYRFFAFESLCGLLLVQAEGWFNDPLSALQICSWILLTGSLLLAVHGFWILHKYGRPKGGFENTTVLVTRGAFRTIRHPLYTSLLLLNLGALTKSWSWEAIALALIAGGCVICTAWSEERENLQRFGSAYATYRRETRMFVPRLF